MDAKDLSTQDLLQLCLQSPDEALTLEFVRRIQPCIAMVVRRTLARSVKSDTSLVDDLVQETFVKLFANHWKPLRQFHWDHENAFFGFLKTVASNVVYDYFRRKRSPIDGPEVVDPESVAPTLPAPGSNAYHHVLINQILRCLRSLENEPTFKRDWTMFHLYFFDGLTAKAISLLPTIDLEVKGVESALYRTLRRVRECLAQSRKGTAAGL